MGVGVHLRVNVFKDFTTEWIGHAAMELLSEPHKRTKCKADQNPQLACYFLMFKRPHYDVLSLSKDNPSPLCLPAFPLHRYWLAFKDIHSLFPFITFQRRAMSYFMLSWNAWHVTPPKFWGAKTEGSSLCYHQQSLRSRRAAQPNMPSWERELRKAWTRQRKNILWGNEKHITGNRREDLQAS